MSTTFFYQDAPGLTVKAVVISADGLWWNTSTQSFETYNSQNIADYALSMSETGTSGLYQGTFPTLPGDPFEAAGDYLVLAGPIAGTSLAESDLPGFSGQTVGYDSARRLVHFGTLIETVYQVPSQSAIDTWQAILAEHEGTEGSAAEALAKVDVQVSSRATPSDLTVLPLSGRALVGTLTPPLVAYQHAAIKQQFAVYDAQGQPVDLSGRNLAWLAYSPAATDTALVELKNYGGENTLSISGPDNNLVNLAGSVSQTPAPGQYQWLLRDMTDNTPLVSGTLRVFPAPAATAP